MSETTFHYAAFIGKPAGEVWNAITQKAIVDQYYMVPVFALELKVGGKISYGTNAEAITGTITEVVEPQKFSHTFRFADSEDPETTVIYEIDPVGDAMCVLRIAHGGFPGENQTHADISGGWPVIISSLKTLLETGKPLPWPKD